MTSIGAVLLSPQLTGEIILFHELHDQFVVGVISPLMKFKGDPPVAIAAFMFVANAADLGLFLDMFSWVRSVFLVMVICASGESRYDQKHCQGVN